MRVEIRAIELAKQYYANQGYLVDDVSNTRGHNGYDFVVKRSDKRTTVEVKGCTREWQIPDLFHTEVDEKRRLVADYLLVVYMIDGRVPFVCEIPRSVFQPESFSEKRSYRRVNPIPS